MRLLITLMIVVAFVQPVCAQGRRVFVLHSGMHILLAPKDKNQAVRVLRQQLLERGIAEADIVGLDCPFPTASWSDVVPREGLLLYLDSADPASRRAQEAYVRLHKTLQDHQVTKADDLVWIGHSAGGQMGMTMAHLAHNLAKYPYLAQQTQAYHFDTVITLGAAVGSNPVPKEVKLRHYYSDGDTMIHLLTKHGNLVAESVNSKVCFGPCCDLSDNCKVRVFAGIEHGYWPSQGNVVDCILSEWQPRCPAWRRANAEIGQGLGLAQLLANTLEAEMKISIEER